MIKLGPLTISAQARDYVEGAFAFVVPTLLLAIADSLGTGTKIDWKVILVLSLSSVAAYIRTRPTQQ